jgi:hypothetical protein
MPKGKHKRDGKPKRGLKEGGPKGGSATASNPASPEEIGARGVAIAEPMREATREVGSRSVVLANLPSTRAELLALHAAVRHRRNSAPLGSPDYQAAVAEIARIEVEIARIERAMDPPLG